MTERVELSLAAAAEKLRSAALVAEEFRIPALDAGIELYIRNKHAAGVKRVGPEKILLYVHGTTQAASATFDLRLDGLSWMDYLALNGYDVYLVDLRGYGRSSRPPEMRAPAADNPPIVTTDVALSDFGAAVDFVLKRRGVPRLAVMGWSWGTSIVASYTARHNARINRLVLYAPVWLRDKPSPASLAAIGAYQTWTVEQARINLQTGAPDEARAGLMPEAWFALWKEAALATDPEGARQSPPVVRSPNGAPKDSRDYWAAGKPYYDPGEITVPTLIVHGEWDGLLPASMAQAIYAKLAGAPKKRFVQIGGGTHMLMLEKNRAQLFHEVQLFLDEPAT